jgi:hypothetical protein
MEEAAHLRREINSLLAKHGTEWAGRIADHADSYSFDLGLVTDISIRGDRLLEHKREIFRAAPILRLVVSPPMDFDELCNMRELEQIRSLFIAGGDLVGDREAALIANCGHLRNLQGLSLQGNVGEAGVRVLASTHCLQSIVYVDLTGNPCTREPFDLPAGGLKLFRHYDEFFTLLSPQAEPLLDTAIRESSSLYSQSFFWPPSVDHLAWVE